MSSKSDPGKAHVPHASTSETGSRPKKRHTTAKLKHPYLLKFESREAKLVKTLQEMSELADNDLVMCDRRTSLNDYTINLQFADKLEALAKSLVMMSTQCCERATDIWQKVSEAQDKKHVANQEIFCLGDVPDIKKYEFVQNRKALHSAAFKSDPDCLPPPHGLKGSVPSRFQLMRRMKKSMQAMWTQSLCIPERTALKRSASNVWIVINILVIHKNCVTILLTTQLNCTNV